MGLCGVGEASLRGFEVLGFLCFWVFLSLAKTLCMNAGPPPLPRQETGDDPQGSWGFTLLCVFWTSSAESLGLLGFHGCRVYS